MHFDELVAVLGEFGQYQKRVYALLCLAVVPCALQVSISMFLLATPKHRCALPQVWNDSYEIQGRSHQSLVNKTVPQDLSGSRNTYAPCRLFQAVAPSVGRNRMRGTVSCSKWVYDKATFRSTVVTKMDLVCEKRAYPSYAEAGFTGGASVGGLLLGFASDRFGRRKIVYFSLIAHLISAFSQTWAPEFLTFFFLRMLGGISVSGVFLAAYILGIELVGPGTRIFTGVVIMYFWTGGLLVLAALTYVIRESHVIEITTSVPSALFLAYWWLIPESPRWLLVTGRKKRAEKLLRAIADVNKTEVQEKWFQDNLLEPSYHVPVVFRNHSFCYQSIIVLYNWFVLGMVDNLPTHVREGSPYLSLLVESVAVIPAYAACLPLLRRFGRKPVYCLFTLLAGLTFIITGLLSVYTQHEHHWSSVTVALVRRIVVGAANCIFWLITAEFCPTSFRGAGVGAGLSALNIGVLVSYYWVRQTVMVGKLVSTVVCGLSAVTAGLLAFVLPETSHRSDLPDVMGDSENFERRGPDLVELHGMRVSEDVEGRFAYSNPF